MSRGQTRLHLAKAHEDRVKTRLAEHGWAVSSYGQGSFCDDVRQALIDHRPRVYWRWMPDLIAARGSRVVLVDGKTDDNPTSENFSFEVDAYMAHLAMSGLGLPIVWVWEDMSCNTPQRLQVFRWQLVPQRGLNRGSGTPYGLVRKAAQHPFEQFFGRTDSAQSRVAS